MRSRYFSRNTRHWLISLLLVAVSVRALIPAGFMPSPDQPFTLQICPDGFPAQLLNRSAVPADQGDHHSHHAHHADAAPAQADSEAPATAHQHESSRAQHCVFAAAAGAGPVTHAPIIAATTNTLAAPDFLSTSPAFESHRYRIQQPRGPPALS